MEYLGALEDLGAPWNLGALEHLGALEDLGTLELFRTLRNPAKTLYLWSVSTRYNTRVNELGNE